MAGVGFSRRLVKTGLRLACPLALSCGWGSAAQAECRRIEIGAVPLDEALLSLARQTGTDIATTESGVHAIRVKPLAGCLSVARVLDRLMRGSGYRAVAAGQGGYRIVKAPAWRVRPSPPPPETAAGGEPMDIIVTGTKQRVALLRFPGSVQIVEGSDFSAGIGRAATLDDLAQMSPIMQKTELGIGRNKLFIRGISDSSFNGPTQTTATVYFGDVQLNHSGPEPALHLADMERVEVLEGPQETLYGAGAISGIIRLAPNPVELDRVAAAANIGATLTETGAPGYDASAMFNLPIVGDQAGLRLVGYRLRDGGYIDDSLRALSNINRTDTVGGRATLRIEPGEGWSLDLGVLGQHIESSDAGYAETVAGAQSRRSFLAQPYSSASRSGARSFARAGTAGWRWSRPRASCARRAATASTGRDFSPGLAPWCIRSTMTAFRSAMKRASRVRRAGFPGWGGVVLLYDRDGQSRVIGPSSAPFEIIGVTNTTRSASAFGEATLAVTPLFSITAGARATIAQTEGEPSLMPREEPSESGFPLKRIQPAIAFSWLFAPRTAAFARFQTGYRTGGIAVARGIGRIANFRPDSISVGEIGVRRERSGPRGISFSTALSLARWKDIQADLFSRRAQPYTDNIGEAEIVAVESAGDWIPVSGLRASFAALWTRNRTSGELAGTSLAENRHLPDTPPFSGNLQLQYQWSAKGGHHFELGGAVRYVGRSVLGTGSFLDLSQGDYTTISAAATWRWRNLEGTINLDNIANESASKFAMGNPLTFGFREETVPVRPRYVRFALAMRW